MNSVLKKAFFAATLATLAVPAFSQSNNPAPVVEQRKENQQDRIGNGVQSGQLTAGETAKLEKKESAINKEENRMETRNNGNLTAADKARLNRQQNHLSNQIYRDKHNGRVQNTNPKTEVGQRQRTQQERIAQGVKSGQLTASETAHLERREAAIHKEVKTERAANGGTLTPVERRPVNRQENRTSKAIYRKKHNGRTQ
jgi:lipopolysaccharide export LptBFGC system permease protein LptF